MTSKSIKKWLCVEVEPSFQSCVFTVQFDGLLEDHTVTYSTSQVCPRPLFIVFSGRQSKQSTTVLIHISK
jgi:hypothetical protein